MKYPNMMCLQPEQSSVLWNGKLLCANNCTRQWYGDNCYRQCGKTKVYAAAANAWRQRQPPMPVKSPEHLVDKRSLLQMQHLSHLMQLQRSIDR